MPVLVLLLFVEYIFENRSNNDNDDDGWELKRNRSFPPPELDFIRFNVLSSIQQYGATFSRDYFIKHYSMAWLNIL